jgi:general secretion pathway protein H
MGGRRERGFTLIELLVVMVIMGVMLGMATLSVAPSRQQSIQQEAQRVALLLQLARDEAIVRNRQIAFEATADSYRFLVRNERQWDPITNDDLLREREFKVQPMTMLLEPAPSVPAPVLRIVFGREPVDKPFVLTLADGDNTVAIQADGIGHFAVQ